MKITKKITQMLVRNSQIIVLSLVCAFLARPSLLVAQVIILPSSGNQYSCTNPLLQRFKQDLVPKSIKVVSQNEDQWLVKVELRNQGNVAFPFYGQGQKALDLRLREEGAHSWQEVKAVISSGVQADQWATAIFPWSKRHPLLNLDHCQKIEIQIDARQDFGQIGCGVLDNDQRLLTVYEGGRIPFCLD